MNDRITAIVDGHRVTFANYLDLQQYLLEQRKAGHRALVTAVRRAWERTG